MNRQTQGKPIPKPNKVPATQYQILAEKLFPLFSMLVLFGFLQILSAFFYNPMGVSGDYYAPNPIVKQEIPFAILVRNTRVGQGMSRKTLADKVNLSIENIESIEEGDAEPTGGIEISLRLALNLPLVTIRDEFATNP